MRLPSSEETRTWSTFLLKSSRDRPRDLMQLVGMLVAHAMAEKHERIVSFSRSISEHEIELLPGVAEVLPVLASRHRLILMTKGNEEEQADKLARSGLAHHFTSVEVPREKNPDAYHAVCHKYELTPHTTWMVGNSPKSDINPALAAGLHAVFIHHPHTWVLEHEVVDVAQDGQHLLELSAFSELEVRF